MKTGRASWLALLAAPVLVLGSQGAMYALVGPSCALQTRVLVHVVAAATLVLVLWFTALAFVQWRHHAQGRWHAADEDLPSALPAFVSGMAVAVGLLSALVQAAMWLGAWVLSPCWQ